MGRGDGEGEERRLDQVDSIGVVDQCGARFMDRSLVRIEWVEQSGRSRLIDA